MWIFPKFPPRPQIKLISNMPSFGTALFVAGGGNEPFLKNVFCGVPVRIYSL